MTPTEYRAALSSLGLSQSDAGRWLGVHPVTARKWAASGCPAPVAKLLRLMVALRYSPEYVDSMIG